MTPGGEARRTGSARERETTVPTTLRPTSTTPAPAVITDLVREVLARLPALDLALALDRPLAVLAQRPAEARRRLSDEVPGKDDDVEDENDDDEEEAPAPSRTASKGKPVRRRLSDDPLVKDDDEADADADADDE